jgi:hypothetical protein
LEEGAIQCIRRGSELFAPAFVCWGRGSADSNRTRRGREEERGPMAICFERGYYPRTAERLVERARCCSTRAPRPWSSIALEIARATLLSQIAGAPKQVFARRKVDNLAPLCSRRLPKREGVMQVQQRSSILTRLSSAAWGAVLALSSIGCAAQSRYSTEALHAMAPNAGIERDQIASARGGL